MIGLDIETGVGASQSAYRNAFYFALYGRDWTHTPFKARCEGVRLVRTTRFMRTVAPKLEKSADRQLKIEAQSTDWAVVTLGKPGPSLADFEAIGQFLAQHDADHPGFAFEWHFADNSFEADSDILSEYWTQFFGTAWLSNDGTRRRNQQDVLEKALGDVFHQVVRAMRDGSADLAD